MDATADAGNFIAVYPDGTGEEKGRLLTWNGGTCCGYAVEHDVDDVAFARAVVTDLRAYFNIDPQRVYATGHSNGGMLAHRLGSEAADVFAAIAPVGAPLAVPEAKPSRPISVMYFHGTADKNALYDGGVGPNSLSKARTISASECVDRWRKAVGCGDATGKVEQQHEATITTYACKDGAEIVHVKIEGMGHTWPGGAKVNTESFAGPMNDNIDANAMMWEFFQRHPLR
jgi:polyhydroxybutyrate depolymerase